MYYHEVTIAPNEIRCNFSS